MFFFIFFTSDLEVQRIALLDIRLLNCDRNPANILVHRKTHHTTATIHHHHRNRCDSDRMRSDSDEINGGGCSGSTITSSAATTIDQRTVGCEMCDLEEEEEEELSFTPNHSPADYMLVPIDHGYCLPPKLKLCQWDWAWFNYQQVSKPVHPTIRAYLKSLDIDELIAKIRPQVPLQEDCLFLIKISHHLLVDGIEAGLSLKDIAQIIARDDDDEPSKLELIISEAEENALRSVELHSMTRPSSNSSNYKNKTASDSRYSNSNGHGHSYSSREEVSRVNSTFVDNNFHHFENHNVSNNSVINISTQTASGDPSMTSSSTSTRALQQSLARLQRSIQRRTVSQMDMHLTGGDQDSGLDSDGSGADGRSRSNSNAGYVDDRNRMISTLLQREATDCHHSSLSNGFGRPTSASPGTDTLSHDTDGSDLPPLQLHTRDELDEHSSAQHEIDPRTVVKDDDQLEEGNTEGEDEVDTQKDRRADLLEGYPLMRQTSVIGALHQPTPLSQHHLKSNNSNSNMNRDKWSSFTARSDNNNSNLLYPYKSEYIDSCGQHLKYNEERTCEELMYGNSSNGNTSTVSSSLSSSRMGSRRSLNGVVSEKIGFVPNQPELLSDTEDRPYAECDDYGVGIDLGVGSTSVSDSPLGSPMYPYKRTPTEDTEYMSREGMSPDRYTSVSGRGSTVDLSEDGVSEDGFRSVKDKTVLKDNAEYCISSADTEGVKVNYSNNPHRAPALDKGNILRTASFAGFDSAALFDMGQTERRFSALKREKHRRLEMTNEFQYFRLKFALKAVRNLVAKCAKRHIHS